MWNVGKFGDMRPYAMLAADRSGRRDDQAGDAAQRGGHRPQGHPPGRGGDRDARRRRDPAGRLAGAARGRADGPPAPPAPAQALPVLQHRDGQAEGVGVHQVPEPRLPRARAGSCSSTSSRRARWTSRASARSRWRCCSSAGWCKTDADFYRLTEEQLTELEGFGEISARNLIAAIEASKERPFARVLFALGIEEVGEVTGRNLAMRFRDIDALLGATQRGDRADAGRRREDGQRDPRAARRRAHARADRRPARDRAALHRGGAAPVGGPAGGQDGRADGDDAELVARAGDRADHGRRAGA